MRKVIITTAAAAMMASLAVVDAQESSWTDGISMNGDFRFRHEYIDKDGKEERQRQRIRARVGLKGEVNEDVTIVLRLASGSDDPVSSNQSLDGGFSTKGFHLDRAYIDWSLAEELDLWAGKMKMPFVAVKDLIWDGDLNLEGIAAKAEAGILQVNAGGFWVEELSGSSDDIMLYGAQAAANFKGDAASILAGASYFIYENIEGAPGVVDGEFFGNSSASVGAGDDAEDVFANEYNEVELFFKASLKSDLPISFYGDYVVNTEADDDDTGYLAGITIGKTKEPGSAKLDYNYRSLEKDAVVGAFADSDSGGGGTGIEGHKISAAYQIAKNLQLGGAFFINSIDPDGADTDYNRGQLDLKAKF